MQPKTSVTFEKIMTFVQQINAFLVMNLAIEFNLPYIHHKIDQISKR